MHLSFQFFFNSILLGVGLAMDAFSVSLANGLNEPCMKSRRMCMMAGIFAFFQALMPMLGWICVHTVLQYFQSFEKLIPWIALGLLGYIGIGMIRESLSGCEEECSSSLPPTLAEPIPRFLSAPPKPLCSCPLK